MYSKTLKEQYNKYIANTSGTDLIKQCAEFYLYYYIIKVIGDNRLEPNFIYLTKYLADFFEVYGTISSYKELIHSYVQTEIKDFDWDELCEYYYKHEQDYETKCMYIKECIELSDIYKITPHSIIMTFTTCSNCLKSHIDTYSAVENIMYFLIKYYDYPEMFDDERWTKIFYEYYMDIDEYYLLLENFGSSNIDDLKKGLPEVADAFIMLNWVGPYGGENWRKIAMHTYRRGSIAYLNSDVVFVDMSWNIQHNTNIWCEYIFDKSEMESDLWILENILDYKREGKMLEIFELCREYDIRLEPFIYNYIRILKVAPDKYPIKHREWKIKQNAGYIAARRL